MLVCRIQTNCRTHIQDLNRSEVLFCVDRWHNNFEASPINGFPLISLTYSLPVIQVGDRWAVVTAGERAWTPWSHVTWYVISHGEVLEAVMQMPTACFTQESARWQRWHRPILEPFGWTQPEARYHWSVSKLQCLGIMGLGIQRYFRVNWNAKRYKDVNTLLLMF